MANIKSAKKRVLTAERNRVRNVAFRTSIAYQLCDKAVSKGILHKNTAARKKSRLTKAVNKLQTK